MTPEQPGLETHTVPQPREDLAARGAEQVRRRETAQELGRSQQPKLGVSNWHAALFVVMVLAGAAAGFATASLASGDSGPSRGFTESSQFGVWQALVAGLIATSVAVAYMTWPSVRRLLKSADKDVRISAILGYSFVALVVIVVPLIMERSGSASFELSYFQIRMVIITLLVVAGGFSCLCGLLISGSMQRVEARNLKETESHSGDKIARLLKARSDLLQFLTGAAVLITAAVLMIGGLKSALDADSSRIETMINNTGYGNDNVVNLSAVGLLMFGAFFAAVLALIFIPAYMSWQANAAAIRDDLYPIPHNGPPGKDWYEGRSSLESLLELRAGVVGRLVAAFGILAPLVGSVVTALVVPTGRG